MDKKSNPLKIFANALVVSSGWALTMVAAIATLFLVLVVFTSHEASIHLIDKFVLNNENPAPLSKQERLVVENLYKKGTLIKVDEVFAHTVAFYDTLVNWLVAIIAVIGIGAVFHIKAISKRHAEEEISRALMKEFEIYISRSDFRQKVSTAIAEELEIRDFRDIEDLHAVVGGMLDKIDNLTKQIEDMQDKSEIMELSIPAAAASTIQQTAETPKKRRSNGNKKKS